MVIANHLLGEEGELRVQMPRQWDQHAVPWSAIAYDAEADRYTTNVTEELLEAAPALKDDSWKNRDWEMLVHQHYKAQPYWERQDAAI